MSRKPTPELAQGFLSIEHAAAWADVSGRTIKRWIRQGLPKYQTGPGSKVLIRHCDIEAFLTKQHAARPELDEIVDEVIQKLKENA